MMKMGNLNIGQSTRDCEKKSVKVNKRGLL